MDRARSMEEYSKILNDILDELADLRSAIEYDEEFMEGALEIISPLEQGVSALISQIDSGSYEFGVGELEFIEIAKRANAVLLPFKTLFMRVEMTHKDGLQD